MSKLDMAVSYVHLHVHRYIICMCTGVHSWHDWKALCKIGAATTNEQFRNWVISNSFDPRTNTWRLAIKLFGSEHDPKLSNLVASLTQSGPF